MKTKLLFCFPHSPKALGLNINPTKLKSHRTVSRCEYTDCDTFNYKCIAQPMKEVISTPFHNESWSDIMDLRSIEILNMNKHVFLMWSGGIDSTGALVSILKNWPKEKLSNLTVLCNGYSIKEYPEFFRDFVSKLNYEIISFRLEEYCKRGILLTGELGDRLAMDMHIRDLKHKDLLRKTDWKDGIVKMYGQEFLDQFLPITDEYPGTITTPEQFFQWFTISQQWQSDMLRLMTSIGSFENPQETFSNVHHFYNIPLFQLWSLYNTEKVISKFEDNDNFIKFTPKTYIHEFAKHDDYLYNKIKMWSLQNIWKHNNTHWGINEHYEYVTRDDLINYIK